MVNYNIVFLFFKFLPSVIFFKLQIIGVQIDFYYWLHFVISWNVCVMNQSSITKQNR